MGRISRTQTTNEGRGRLPRLAKKPSLKTVEGLHQTASQLGFEKESQRIGRLTGERPKEIFSGGFISDTFDILNALQYGVTGLIKGKSFMEGVRTRQSFSDKDALGDFGIPGAIAGIAMDIAVDPLTWIAPLTLFRKIPGATKAARVTLEAAKKTRAGQFLGSKFVYRFGQDPIYAKIAERMDKSLAVNQQNLLNIVRPLTKLNARDQKIISEFRKAGKIDSLPRELLERSKPAFDELDKLGKQAVDVGLLPKDVYDKNIGSYIPLLYKTKEAPGGLSDAVRTSFGLNPKRIDLSRFKKRGDIPEDVRNAMGEILEAGYPTAKALTQLNSSIEKAKFFQKIAQKWGSNIAEEGLEQLPQTARLGALAGKYVPKFIADDINEIARPFKKGLLQKATALFKFNKVILNPSTHARNVMSNFILNDFEGLSPARLDIYAKAARELATQGPLYKEAKAAGLGLNTFAAQELKMFLLGPEGKGLIPTAKRGLSKIADLYQKEEEFAKMAQYIYQKSLGKNADEAFEIAERATFNYAQVTPFIRKVRESAFGLPFITFTTKATPQIAKTLVTKPGKISKIGKIKQAIESQSDLKELEAERAVEPDWIRDGFYIKLPMKDKHGRSAYLDLTYILPFGDLMSGQFIERGIKRETGLPEGIPEALLKKAPALNLIKELGRNQDFFGNKIWLDSDSQGKQLGDVMRHVTKLFAPQTFVVILNQ